MKATELRIGNIVNYCNSVKQLDAELFLQLLKYTTPFEPIPITEEWLLKFGFKKHDKHIGSYIKTPKFLVDGYGFRFHTQHPFSEDLFNSVVQYYYMEKQLYVKNGVKYVHQLQNLYFTLTGEELTINENNA